MTKEDWVVVGVGAIKDSGLAGSQNVDKIIGKKLVGHR